MIVDEDEATKTCESLRVLETAPVTTDPMLEGPPTKVDGNFPKKPSASSYSSASAITDLASTAAKLREELLAMDILTPRQGRKFESFTLYTVEKGTPFYWNTAKQQLMLVYLPGRGTNIHLGKLIIRICRVLAFTATEITHEELSKTIPNEVLDVILPQGVRNQQKNSSVFRGWSKNVVKRQFIQDGPTYAAVRLGKCGLWPPPEASFQLRQEMWELYFVPDIVELVFGGWHGSGVLDLRKIMLNPESVLSKWLWHVYIVLLEITFRFRLHSEDITKSCTLSRQISSIGAARNCLARESWEEVIEHFEADVLSTCGYSSMLFSSNSQDIPRSLSRAFFPSSALINSSATGEGLRLDYRSVECTPGFGKMNITDKSAKWKFLRRFTADLRQRDPELFPPSLRQHFQDNPPGFAGRMKNPVPEAGKEAEEVTSTNECL
ncbi:hypothetical protein ONS95_013600 [Cadophora gregata]|uniref:uncharacterized protein n=1 Tax=Cadophora gregata TaxID=51156 RepID=UPI0026DBD400|nr:uncharacterized protein ONS95_013600 [Cadophora gregata]KAK0114095.1 hypothetical protein ONS95_013600 [Cadophora gregata]